jgi:hypothetical protein
MLIFRRSFLTLSNDTLYIWDGGEIFNNIEESVVFDMSNPKFIRTCKFVIDFSYEFQSKNNGVNLVQDMMFHSNKNSIFVLLTNGILCFLNLETFYITILDYVIPQEKNLSPSFKPVSFSVYYQNQLEIGNIKTVNINDSLKIETGKMKSEIIYICLYDKNKNYYVFRFNYFCV